MREGDPAPSQFTLCTVDTINAKRHADAVAEIEFVSDIGTSDSLPMLIGVSIPRSMPDESPSQFTLRSRAFGNPLRPFLDMLGPRWTQKSLLSFRASAQNDNEKKEEESGDVKSTCRGRPHHGHPNDRCAKYSAGKVGALPY